MSELKIMDRVKTLKGSTFMYQTRNYKVLNTYEEGDNIIIATDKKCFNIPQYKLAEFLADFLEVDPEEESLQETRKQVQNVTSNAQLKSLANILFDNIEAIKKDKSFIDQAEAINEQAKSIIDIAKLEVDLIKTLKGR